MDHVWYHIIYNIKNSIEDLKNALLSFAMMQVCTSDKDNSSMHYDKFDGTKLPIMSGSSLENAYFSYIIDKDDYLFYSPIILAKLNAIDKNLGNSTQVFDFFDKFIKKMKKN